MILNSHNIQTFKNIWFWTITCIRHLRTVDVFCKNSQTHTNTDYPQFVDYTHSIKLTNSRKRQTKNKCCSPSRLRLTKKEKFVSCILTTREKRNLNYSIDVLRVNWFWRQYHSFPFHISVDIRFLDVEKNGPLILDLEMHSIKRKQCTR